MSRFVMFEAAAVAQVTAVSLAAIGLMGVFYRQAAMRHAIGVSGLFLVLVSPLLALAWPRPFWLTAGEARPIALTAADDQPSAPESLYGAAIGEISEENAANQVVSATADDITPMAPRDLTAPGGDFKLAAEVAELPAWRNFIYDWRKLALVVGNLAWLAGVIVFATRHMRSFAVLNCLRRSLETWPSRPAFRDEQEICRDLGLNRLPPIMLSGLAPMPLVLGTWKPIIVLPRALAELAEDGSAGRAGSAAEEKLRTIIIHEAAHIARRDPWILAAQLAAQTVFWWHPGVSRVNGHVNRSREELCDNHVLRRSDAAGYAEMLLEFVLRGPAPAALGLFSVRWSLEQRISGLLSPNRDTATGARRGRASACVLLLLALSAIVGGIGAFDTLPSEASAPERKTESSEQQTGDAEQQPGAALKKVSIRGVCVDRGQPIAGARVRIFRYPSRLDPPLLVADLTTGEDGRFAAREVDTAADRTDFDGLGDLCVAATAEERVSLIQRIDSEADDIELSLAFGGNPGALSGVVTDEAGRPIPGARVFLPWAYQEPLPGILIAVTDDTGRFTISGLKCWNAGDVLDEGKDNKKEKLVMGSCNFLLDHPDYARTTAQFTGVPSTVNVTLHPAAIVEGVVIDAVTQRPAANVIVSAQGVARSGWYQTRTDREGRYRLRMTKDHYNIWAESLDRIAIAAKAVEAEPGKTISVADISLVRGGFVTGRVIDAATNKPVAPAEKRPLRVAHYGPARPRTGAAVTSAVVNPDGTYRLRVAPGKNYVYLMNGQGSQTVAVEDGQEVERDLIAGRHQPTADFDADMQLADKLRRRAEQEDAIKQGLPGANKAAIALPALRERGNTPIARLLDRLEGQNAGGELFKDSWLRTLKEIVELGPAAVPELTEELDATQDDKMLRCLGFALRAIGDKRAVPALVRAIPKTLRPPGSDMGLQAEDKELLKFAQLHDLDPGDRDNRYSFGRPVREICGALQQLTGQNFGEEQIYNVFLDGLPSQRRMKRELFQRTAQAWSNWWEKGGAIRIPDPAYARVNLPKPPDEIIAEPLPPGTRFKTAGAASGWILESVLNPQSRTVFYDFDTGRASALPDRWRTAKSIEPHLEEIIAWAQGEGFDLMGTEYAPLSGGERIFALRPVGLRAWELGENRWKMQSNDVTLEALQAEGTPADGLLMHYDNQAEVLDPKATATFLFITREGTPGLLFVGVEVQDDSLMPGGRMEGDTELQPIAFRKGRRFGFNNFEQVQPAEGERR